MVPLGLFGSWQHLPCDKGGAYSVSWPQGRPQRLPCNGEVPMVPRGHRGLQHLFFYKGEVGLVPTRPVCLKMMNST